LTHVLTYETTLALNTINQKQFFVSICIEDDKIKNMNDAKHFAYIGTFIHENIRHIIITTKEHYTDIKILQAIIDDLMETLQTRSEIKLLQKDNKKDEICKYEQFIPLYAYDCKFYSDGEICGLSYIAKISDRLRIQYAYYEDETGEIVIDYFIDKHKDLELTDDEIKFITYLFAYTHYCMGNNYGKNTHYSVAFECDECNDHDYTKPLGYIYKVDVPFMNIEEFERLIDKLQVQFYSEWEEENQNQSLQ